MADPGRRRRKSAGLRGADDRGQPRGAGARLQELPGFHQQKLDNAMRDATLGKSRTDANLWKRSEAEAQARKDEEASHDAASQH
jgi:hypothetical protein